MISVEKFAGQRKTLGLHEGFSGSVSYVIESVVLWGRFKNVPMCLSAFVTS